MLLKFARRQGSENAFGPMEVTPLRMRLLPMQRGTRVEIVVEPWAYIEAIYAHRVPDDLESRVAPGARWWGGETFIVTPGGQCLSAQMIEDDLRETGYDHIYRALWEEGNVPRPAYKDVDEPSWWQ